MYNFAGVLNGIYKLQKKMESSQWLQVKTSIIGNSACNVHCQLPLYVCGPST